jgi:hypothetical protein
MVAEGGVVAKARQRDRVPEMVGKNAETDASRLAPNIFLLKAVYRDS